MGNLIMGLLALFATAAGGYSCIKQLIRARRYGAVSSKILGGKTVYRSNDKAGFRRAVAWQIAGAALFIGMPAVAVVYLLF